MSTPRDRALYNRVKARVYKSIPRHSAYRSATVVQRYKAAYRQKHGSRGSPYSGSKSKTRGLSRWFAERWRNQRGTVGYSRRGDVYRPTRRVSSKTPKTFRQLSKSRLRRAMREKRSRGRVSRF
jgi:hypothetical protein